MSDHDLLEMLGRNKIIHTVLERAPSLNMPNWYLGGGSISQTVWNIKHGFDPEYGIKDYDLVYYNGNDVSYKAEDEFIKNSNY